VFGFLFFLGEAAAAVFRIANVWESGLLKNCTLIGLVFFLPSLGLVLQGRGARPKMAVLQQLGRDYNYHKLSSYGGFFNMETNGSNMVMCKSKSLFLPQCQYKHNITACWQVQCLETTVSKTSKFQYGQPPSFAASMWAGPPSAVLMMKSQREEECQQELEVQVFHLEEKFKFFPVPCIPLQNLIDHEKFHLHMFSLVFWCLLAASCCHTCNG
jgi:hypothetical protein